MRHPRRVCVGLIVLAAGIVPGACAAGEFMPDLREPPQSREAPPASFLPAISAASPADWKSRRAALHRAWTEIIGRFPARVPLDAQIISTELLQDHTRILVRYQSDPLWRNEAYVLLPKTDAPAKRPGMVVLHQTSKTNMRDAVGLDGRDSVHIALHLVRRGYVCVAPRNFLWSFEGKNYQQAAEAVLAQKPWKTGMAKMTWDAIRATDLLLEQPGVDPQRIGTIGHSLGGKEALYHAAFDERIKAAVSCEGGVGISMSNWDADWYLGKQVKSPDFRGDHHEIVALIAPRALLIIGGESADGAKSWPYVEANLALWKLLEAQDRIGLLRHAHGHNFPPPGDERERVYKWLEHFLEHRASVAE